MSRRIARFLFVVGIAFLAAPQGAFGDLSRFIPRIYSNEGELEFGALYDGIRNTSAGRGVETTDTVFTERFTLTTVGYVYHPRFVQFLGRLSLGLNQEKFTEKRGTSPSSEGSWTTVFTDEYEFRALALPEHPYNLELYALRRNPFIRGQDAGGFETVAYNKGANFNYKKRPYFFRLTYDLSTIESKSSTTDGNTLVATGGYVKNWGTFTGGGSHTESETSQGGLDPIRFTLDSYSFENRLNFPGKKVWFATLLNETVFTQSGPTATINDKRFSWTEQLGINLPWNFETNFSYRFTDDDMTTRPTVGAPETALSNRQHYADMMITQKLYESLVTSYSFNYYRNLFPGGEVQSYSHSLNFAYKKKIPYGRLFAGIDVGRTTSEGTGAQNIFNEIHNAQMFGEFTLQRVNIEEASIAVTVRSALNGSLVSLTRDIDYAVSRIGNTVLIRILSIPAEASSSDPLFTYEFRIAYSLVSADFEMITTKSGRSLRLELFDRLVNPYYSHSRTDQEVVSGVFPGGGDLVTVDTVGISFVKPPYSILVEYQYYDSRLNPSKTFRAEANARTNLIETMTLAARAYYSNVVHPDVPEEGTVGFTEQSVGGSMGVDKRFPRRNLTISLSDSYSRTKGLYLTRRNQVIGTMTWKVAKLDLALRVEIGSSVTDLPVGTQESERKVFYLTVKRKLF